MWDFSLSNFDVNVCKMCFVMFTLPRKPKSEYKEFGLKIPELYLIITLEKLVFLGHEFFHFKIKGPSHKAFRHQV